MNRIFHIAACIVISIISFKYFSRFFKEAPPHVSVMINVKVPKDDVFQLFYRTESIHQFLEETSIKAPVKGGDQYQKIVFALSDSLNVTSIRIDIGEQLDSIEGQETIWVKNIAIANSNGASYSFSGDSLVSFFHPVWIENIGHDGMIVTKRYGGTYDPSLESDDITVLMERLKVPATAPLFPILISVAILLASGYVALVFVPPLSIPAPAMIKIAFVLVFLIIVFIPLSAKLLNLSEDQDNLEKRQLESMPEFSMTKAFAKDFEKYYNDNFGLRDYLISLASFLKVNVFHTPMNPEKVMIGEEGWLFYNNSDGADLIFRSYTHLNALEPEELKNEVTTLEERQRQCKKAGITYIKGFWPQTHTIYPEYLPALMKLQIRDTPSKADQIIEYLKETGSSFRFIDVRPALFAKKKEAQLYFKLDTHWNELGAFFAYQSFLDQCYPELGVKPRSLDEFEVTWHRVTSGDLTNMLGLRDPSVFKDKTPSLKYIGEPPFKYIPADGYPAEAVVTVCENCDKRTLLVFGDSYFGHLRKYFSMHFAKVIYVAGPYNQEYVDQYKCDIIIEAPVERYL